MKRAYLATCVNGSVFQGCAVDIQIVPTNDGVISTPPPIELLSLASLPRYLDLNKKGGCVKSGRSGAYKAGKIGLSNMANICRNLGT